MGWFDLKRVPEPEAMDDLGEVEAYASAAAQAHLDRIDDSFVEQALSLVHKAEHGSALDIGAGPGQILLKLARRLPGWRFIGVDRSPNMLRQAHASLADAERSCAGLSTRTQFLMADGNRLAFPDRGFDLVMCNSVLHHLSEPQRLFEEIARVAKPGGAVLIRDLRRPARLAYPWHVRWHGRHYSGLMYQLFCASVRSAYTRDELETMLRASPLAGVRVFAHHRTHLGIARRRQ